MSKNIYKHSRIIKNNHIKFFPERKPQRLKEYNYSQNNIYFITIITKNRIAYFGKIENDRSILNDFGKIVYDCWMEIPIHFNEIELLEFIVMPNHLHGLLEVRNRHACSLQKRQYQLIPSVIGSFKAAVSKKIKMTESAFQWHKSFYDHIIRDEKDLLRIQEYINFNPLK